MSVRVEGDPVQVVAAVIRRGRSFLLGLRPTGKRHAGLWEFPGGKLGPCESIADAAQRELREELGLTVVSVGDVLFTAHDPGSPFEIKFVEVEATGDPVAVEHRELRWVTASEVAGLRLAPADARFVRSTVLQVDHLD